MHTCPRGCIVPVTVACVRWPQVRVSRPAERVISQHCRPSISVGQERRRGGFRLTTDLAGLAQGYNYVSIYLPTAHTHTHIAAAAAPSLQVNGFDSCPLHLSLSPSPSLPPSLSFLCPSQMFALSVLISLRLPHLRTSRRRPPPLCLCISSFVSSITFSISSLPHFSFLSSSPHPLFLPLSYLECVCVRVAYVWGTWQSAALSANTARRSES